MKSTQTRMHVHDRKDGQLRSFYAAASLHCHTSHSREMLTFIPHYASMLPIVSGLFKAEMNRYLTLHGRTIDFGAAYWTPPALPREVMETETRQIEHRLGLKALVSITDHDDIEAGLQLQVIEQPNRIPISLEWTVPYRDGFFHLGIHNLHRGRAAEVNRELMKFTRREADALSLEDLFAMLSDWPGTLIVFNHPLWDIEFIGAEKHAIYLKEFLNEYGKWIHALELNGFRSWRENRAVMRMAAELGYPVVTGGDRHGCRSNTVLNLTRAKSFEEFVAEVREDHYSEILLLPEYREPVIIRTMESAADVIRHYPNHPLGQTKWTDRIFINLDPDDDSSQVYPLSRYWLNGGPVWVRASLRILRLLGSPQLKPALRLALAGERAGYES